MLSDFKLVAQGIGLDARPSTSERFPKHPDNCAARAGNTSVFDASRGSCQAAPHNRYPSGTGVRKRSRPGGSTGFRHHNGTSKESSERGETSDSDMEQGGETTQSQKRRKIGPAHRRAGHATQAGRRCFPQVSPRLFATWLGLGLLTCLKVFSQVHADLPHVVD